MLSRRNTILLLSLFLLNSDLFKDFAISYKKNKLDRCISRLDNFQISANVDMISNLKLSDNILNKPYVIDRINNTSYKIYKDGLPKDKNYYGFYSFDELRDIDYIVLDTNTIVGDFLLIHEIGHLIDEHKILREEIDVLEIVKDSITVYDFTEFYDEFPDISFSEFSEDSVPYGQLIYLLYESNKSYYASSSEIYARLFSYKNFCIENDLKNVEDVKRHILRSYNGQGSDIIKVSIDIIDFIIILPIIDFQEKEKMKLLF